MYNIHVLLYIILYKHMHVIYIHVSPVSNVADLQDHLTWMLEMTPMDQGFFRLMIYKAAPHVQVPRAQESELDFFTLTDPSYDVLEPIPSG